MSWIGGKKSLRDLIVNLFPLYYERYIEVFGGGGWILFHKPPGNDFEVYNDFNGLLVNLYRCVRETRNAEQSAMCNALVVINFKALPRKMTLNIRYGNGAAIVVRVR